VDRNRISAPSSDVPEKPAPEYAENRSSFDSAEQPDSPAEDIRNLTGKSNSGTVNQKGLRRHVPISSEESNLAFSGKTREDNVATTGEGFASSSDKDLPVERGDLHASGNQAMNFAGQPELAVLAK